MNHQGARQLRAIVTSAVMAALALTLPMVFHVVGLGSKFLPMLLPLLLNAILSPPRWAGLTAFVVPLASAVLTGMPPLYPPAALVMSVEAAAMAVVGALLYHATRPRIWPALTAAVLVNRLTSFGLMWWLAGQFGLPAGITATAVLLKSLPGVVLMLTVIPLVVRALSRRPGLLFRDDEESEAAVFQ